MADVLLLADLTDFELYQAALFARVCLVVREAAVGGLVSADLGDVDIERCEEIVAVAADHGIEPDDDAVDAALIASIGETPVRG